LKVSLEGLIVNRTTLLQTNRDGALVVPGGGSFGWWCICG